MDTPFIKKQLVDSDGEIINPAISENQSKYFDIANGTRLNTSSFRGFGQRSSLSTATNGDDVWEGTATTCPFPATAGERMSVVSSSASDTSDGTGVRTIIIQYLDANGDEVNETITLSGVTAVHTVATNIRFVQQIHSQTVGSVGVAVGTISIYKYGDANIVYTVIKPGGNLSLNSLRMIPRAKKFFMLTLSIAGTSNKPLSVRLRATSDNGNLTEGLFFLFKDICFVQNSIREKVFIIPLVFPSLCIIKITAYSAQAGGDISIGYDGWIE